MMNTKYWIVPAIAVAAIAATMVYSLDTTEKPTAAASSTTFIDGTKISEIKYETSDAVDKHKVALIKIIPGTEKGVSLAVHLNDAGQNIIFKAGDFPLAAYCKGEQVLECSIPIAADSFNQSATLGVAAYKVQGELFQVTEGRSDWDGHRALFPINQK